MQHPFSFHYPNLLYAPDEGAGGGAAPIDSAPAVSAADGVPTLEGADAGAVDAKPNENGIPDDDIGLTKNRMAELARKQAKLADIRAQLADTNKQLADAKAKHADKPATEGNPEDEVEFKRSSVSKETADYLDSLGHDRDTLIERLDAAEQRLAALDPNSIHNQYAAAEEATAVEFCEGLFEGADKAFKNLPPAQMDSLRTKLVSASINAFAALGVTAATATPDQANQVLRETIADFRALFGSLGEAAIRDAATVREQIKVKPGSGTNGTQAPPALHQMDAKGRRSAARQAALAAEQLRPG